MLYKTLCNINLYHTYFLNEGERPFFTLNGQNNNGITPLTETEKKKAEESYDINSFLTIVPRAETVMQLKNHRLLAKQHAKGLRIIAEAQKETAEEGNSEVTRFSTKIPLNAEVKLTFYIKVHDPFFENYTNIVTKKQHQLYTLSNTNSTVTNIFDASTQTEKWGDFLLSEKETRSLVHQLEIAKQAQLPMPSLVTIANIDQTTLDTIENKITNAIALTKEEEKILNVLNTAVKVQKSQGVIGIIQLQMEGNNNTKLVEDVLVKNKESQQFDVTKQCLLKTIPEFTICVENRKTFWRYKEISNNLIMTTTEEKPLTQNGRVEIVKQDLDNPPNNDYYFPNPTAESITEEAQKYYSEIVI
ncbi:hypothetical protein [Tenacibaculum sp. 190524A02b]|uniref:hypothetical protein n=1 Tax=Tenacibaculum vairaonense TaxID=3137860 RepID=UPI0031FA55DD